MKFSPITTLAALFIIGSGGFMAGRISSTDSSAGTAEASASAARLARSNPGGSTDGNLATKSARPSKTDRKNGNAASQTDRFPLLESIARSENPLERSRALLDYLDQLGPSEFEGAVAHFRSLGLTDARLGDYSIMLTAWAQADPQAALEYSLANTGGNFARETVLTSWAATDPEAVLQWAKAKVAEDPSANPDAPNPYLAGIIRGLAQSDPNRATELLASMPISGERGRGLDFLLPHLLQQGADATRSWIANLSDESLRNGAMMRVAERFAATDPAGTASWLLANPGEAAQRRIDDVYSTWAAKDPQAALSSYATIPPGEARMDALRGVIGAVAAENPRNALALMDRNPSDVNDQVVRNFVRGAFDSDPLTAVSQISRIGDEREREQAYRRALDVWIERDATSAINWINTNSIPDNIRNRIIRRQSERE